MQLRRDDLLMYVGVIFFLLFILYNVKAAYERGALWLPSKYLVLSGLILQLAAEAEVKNVTMAGPHQQAELDKLMGRQLSIDSARLTLCVFVGYLLPGMGTTAYKGTWTTIAALLISLATHICMEFFIAVQLYVKAGNDIRVRNQSWVWFILSGVLLTLLLVSFFIGMVYAILIAKYYRDNLSERIKAIIGPNYVEMEWEKLEEEVLKSWILARVCQPDYISARTAYGAGVGVAVTVCVVFFGIKVVCLRSLLNQRLGLFLFQWVFILVGWLVILYRWLGPLYYFVVFRDKSNSKPKSELRAFRGMVNTPVSHVLRSLLSISVDAKMLKFIVPVLLLPLLFWQMIVTEIVMKLTVKCWVISWWVFDNKVVRSLSKAATKLEKLKSCRDFLKYEKVLDSLRTPAEDVAGLWIANESCFASVKQAVEASYDEGARCKELIELIESYVDRVIIGSDVDDNNVEYIGFANELVPQLPSVKKYFPSLKEPLWSITAVSLLDIIIQVTPINAVDKAVKAFEQAYPLMDLADCPDNIDITVDNFGSSNLQSFLISQASSDAKAKVMTSYKNMKREQHAGGAERSVTLKDARKIIKKKLKAAKSSLRENQLLKESGVEDSDAGAIGVEWLFMAPKYADYKVCEPIWEASKSYSSVDELRSKLLVCLKDVISSCVLHLPNLLFKKVRYWAAELEEQNICKAAQIIGKAQGVIDEARKMVEPNAVATPIEHGYLQA